jgi:outer membrane receptor protein involved in Fe transport
MKKLIHIIATVILIWGGMLGLAQAQSGNATKAEIIGSVEDTDGTAIPNATIAIYNQAQSEILTGTSSNQDGSFSLMVDPGSYILQISFISYRTNRTSVELKAGDTLDLDTIVLQNEDAVLDEVIVEGERSYMQMNFDSRSFNVGKDITSLGGSALDVLDNVPSLTVDYEGNVSLRGNSGVQVLINGRPSSLVRNGTEALSSIPSNVIEEVEIITNPSARYSASGTGGIINIKLVDDVTLGFNGSVQANTGYPQDHGLGANLNYHKNNINWFGNFEIEYENDPGSGSTFQSFSGDTTYAYRETSESDETEREGSAYFGADFFLPANQVITLSSRISIENEQEDSDVRYTDYDPVEPGVYRNVFDSWEIMQRINRNDIQENRENDFDVRLQYENRFEGADHRLTADADFEFGQQDENSNLIQQIETGVGNPLNQRTFSDEVYREMRFDTDYERPLGNNGRLEAGMRLNFDWMDNDYIIEEQQNGLWVTPDGDLGISDNFTFYENVNALYTTLAGESGKFSYQAGVRAENTRIQTELDRTGEGSDQNYLNLFPSVFLSYSMNEKNSFQISYSRRIDRPWSRMLLPFTEISDTRNRRVGNPELKPEFGNSFELGYLRYWNTGSLLSSVYYRNRTEVIERVSTIDGQGITTTRPINLATEDSWGVEFSADQELFNNMQLSGSLNIFQSDREGEYQDQIYTSSTGRVTSRLRIRWNFLDSWNFQSFLNYESSQQTTQGREDGSMYVGSGISKEFLNRRATLSLNVRDLFNSRQYNGEIINPNSYTDSNYQWSTRSFRLNFRYNFGGASRSGDRG